MRLEEWHEVVSARLVKLGFTYSLGDCGSWYWTGAVGPKGLIGVEVRGGLKSGPGYALAERRPPCGKGIAVSNGRVRTLSA